MGWQEGKRKRKGNVAHDIDKKTGVSQSQALELHRPGPSDGASRHDEDNTPHEKAAVRHGTTQARPTHHHRITIRTPGRHSIPRGNTLSGSTTPHHGAAC